MVNKSSTITEYGYNSIIFFLMKASFIGMGYYIIFENSYQDSYIAALIGIIIGFISIIILNVIRNNKNKLDIIDLNKKLFGTAIGGVINIIVFSAFLIFGISLLYNYTLFIESYYIQETVDIYVLFIIIFPILYLANKGITVISRVSQLLIIINEVIFILGILGSIKNISVDNLFPIMESSNANILYSSIVYAIFATAPIFLLTIVSKNMLIEKKLKLKYTIIAYILSCLKIVMIILFIVLILGRNMAVIFKYPEYYMLKEINFFDIVEKIENTIALMYVFDFFVCITMIIYFLKTCLEKALKDTRIKKYSCEFIVIFMAIASMYIFKNSIFAMNIYESYGIYFLGFGIILPMTITALFTKVKETT